MSPLSSVHLSCHTCAVTAEITAAWMQRYQTFQNNKCQQMSTKVSVICNIIRPSNLISSCDEKKTKRVSYLLIIYLYICYLVAVPVLRTRGLWRNRKPKIFMKEQIQCRKLIVYCLGSQPKVVPSHWWGRFSLKKTQKNPTLPGNPVLGFIGFFYI